MSSHWRRKAHGLSIATVLSVVAACATTGERAASKNLHLYAMPAELSEALAPGEAHPARPAELAEAALHLLDPERPGGPDYLGAARMCLLAADAISLRARGFRRL